MQIVNNYEVKVISKFKNSRNEQECSNNGSCPQLCTFHFTHTKSRQARRKELILLS